MKSGHRFILIMLIVLIILFALAAFGYFTGGWEAEGQERQQPFYGDMPLDATLIKLDKRALDTAYEQRVVKLWEIWISPTTRDAINFTNGLKTARQRYSEAAIAIARRERQLLEQDQK